MSVAVVTQDNTNFTVNAQIVADQSTAYNLTAHAGGGQTSALPLTATRSYIGAVASANDSVALPLGVAGMSIQVDNEGANACQVFAANGSTDTINGTAGSTGVSHPAATTKTYACYKSAPGAVWTNR